MYSANAPSDAPHLFRRYFTGADYARIESLPPNITVARRHRYVLPTTLRSRWRGDPGLRHWIRQGCGRGTPGTIVYDPEHRPLTPVQEQHDFLASIREAARLVRSTGCHAFGLAPGSRPFFGLDPDTCTYDLDAGFYPNVRWRSVDLVDIQAQRLLGDDCVDQGGTQRYASVVAAMARFVRGRNPHISVVSQVSFRDSPPSRMKIAIARVADVVDGIYFSYPSTNLETPCRYCTPANLRSLLSYLRG